MCCPISHMRKSVSGPEIVTKMTKSQKVPLGINVLNDSRWIALGPILSVSVTFTIILRDSH